MADIYTIAGGLIIVFITVLFFYYNFKKKQVNDQPRNLSKEELLKARLNFFHKSQALCNEELQKVNDQPKNLSKEELLKTRLDFFQKSQALSNEELQKASEKKSTSFSILPQSTKIVESTNKKNKIKLGADDPHLTSLSHYVETSIINTNFKSNQTEVHQDNSPVTSKEEKEKLNLIKREKKGLINEVVLKSFSSWSEPSLPTILPIKSINEMLAWVPGYDEFCISTIPRRNITRMRNCGKTLVCHDMKGGYTEDRFVQGFASDKCYRFHDWNHIDLFCYFSHNLVTIPPPCWTNSAHVHGVKSLGTFITEWEDGAKVCAEIFMDDSSVKRIANILVEIACYYKFDGWLINIENNIMPSQIDNLKKFIQILTKRLHVRIPGAEVIWYDSVLYTGQLKWQNKLCLENRVFFDLCDGIFLNYNWSINDLQHSILTCGEGRRYDIYVGVDVFGRGCFGGGGWNTYKALQVIREKNLSVAIFAPGWVMENHGEENFTRNSKKFWELLTSYIYPHFLHELPFITSFCQGYGTSIFVQGKVVQRKSWTNLSAQNFQPSFSNNLYQLGPKEGMQIECIDYQTEDGYNGGGCLYVKGTTTPREEQTRTVLRLFKMDIKLAESTNYSLEFTYKCLSDRVQLFLLVLLEGNPSYMIFKPDEKEIQKCSVSSIYAVPKQQENSYVFQEPNNKISTENEAKQEANWLTRRYNFTAQNTCCLQEIRVVLATGGITDVDEKLPFTVFLGEIKICLTSDLERPITAAKSIRCHSFSSTDYESKKKLCFTLSWDVSFNENEAAPRCYDIFCVGNDNQTFETNYTLEEFGSFVGRAYGCSYYVNNLLVPNKCSAGIVLTVQSVSELNTRQSYSDCAKILIKWH